MKKIILFGYFINLVIFSVFSYLFIDTNFKYLEFIYTGFNWTHHKLTALIYVILISLFFSFYVGMR